MAIAERAASNVDRIISDSLKGEGILAAHLETAYGTILGNETLINKRREKNGTGLTKEQIEQQATQKLEAYASGQLKQNLLTVAEGKPLSVEEGAELNKMMGMAGAAGQVSSAFSGGGIGAIFSALQAVMSNFGEYVMAAVSYFFPGDNPNPPKSFGEALADIRAKKEVSEFAKNLGVGGEQLMGELNAATASAPAAAPAGSVSAAQQQAQGAAPITVTIDPNFNKPNGSDVVPPAGGPADSAAVGRSTGAILS